MDNKSFISLPHPTHCGPVERDPAQPPVPRQHHRETCAGEDGQKREKRANQVVLQRSGGAQAVRLADGWWPTRHARHGQDGQADLEGFLEDAVLVLRGAVSGALSEWVETWMWGRDCNLAA